MYRRDIKRAKAQSPAAAISAREPYYSWPLPYPRSFRVAVSLLAPSGAGSESIQGFRRATVFLSYMYFPWQRTIKVEGCSSTERVLLG